MVKLRDAESTCVDVVQKIDRARVRLLWATSYWDGPLDGLARLDDEEMWFSLAEEAEDERIAGWFRRYWLVRLTDDQLSQVRIRWDDFRRFVGAHFDYDETWTRHPERTQPQSQWHNFYDKYGQDRGEDLFDNEVIGWFQW